MISKDENLNSKFKEEMHQEVISLDLSNFLTKIIDDQITKVLTSAGFQQTEEFNLPEAFHYPEFFHTSINPRKQEPIQNLIPKWLNLKSTS